MDENIVGIDRSTDELARISERLKSGGGGGTYDGMEPRIAKLEARADGIEKRLDDIKTDIGRVESKLLTKWDVAQVVFFVVGALMAAIVFGPRIANLITP